MAVLPKFKLNLKGKTFGVKNTIVYPVAGAAVVGAGALLFSMYGKNFSWNIGNLFGQTKETPKAVRVNFNVYPPVVKPFRKIRVQGSFEDSNGVVAPVPIAYYGIFESIPAGSDFKAGRLLVSNGVLGQNVGSFRQDLPTDNFRTGSFVIYISTKPITSDPLQGDAAALQLMGRAPITIG